jgi:predicted secreted protein
VAVGHDGSDRTQNEKWALARGYAVAERLLLQTKEAATVARVEATLNREQVRRSAEQLIQDARVAFDAARTSLQTAPRGKGTEADPAAMRADLKRLQNELD